MRMPECLLWNICPKWVATFAPIQVLALMAGAFSISGLASNQRPESGTPVALDLAFGRKSFPAEMAERPGIVNGEGTAIAYVVHTPPLADPAAGRELLKGILPNGVPRSCIGNMVYISDLKHGGDRPAAPMAGNCWAPSFSPDGRLLAFYCDADGMPQLWRYQVATGKAARVSTARIKAHPWAGDEPQWSVDSREVFVPLAPEWKGDVTAGRDVPADDAKAETGLVEEVSSIRVHRAGSESARVKATTGPDPNDIAFQMRVNNAVLAAINVESGAVRIVVPANAIPPPSVLQVSPSGKWISYLSVFHPNSAQDRTNFHDLAVAPAAGGMVRLVGPNIRVGYRSESYYFGAYSWHPNRDQIIWVSDRRLWTVDLTEQATASVIQLAAELGDLASAPISFTRDGAAVVVGIDPIDLHDNRDPRPRALALVPLDKGQAKIVRLPSDVIFETVINQKEGTLWQSQPGVVSILGRNATTTESVVLQLAFDSATVSTIWRRSAHIEIAGAPRDHRFLVGSVEDFHTTPNLYRFHANFVTQDRLTEIEPRMASVRFGAAETFETSVPQHDGSFTKVKTAILLPESAKRGNRLPAIVYFYPGLRFSHESSRFGGEISWMIPTSIFISRGYAVLLADAPIGPFGRPGNPIAEMVDVLVPQVYRAAELGYIDLNRVALTGQSGGGYGTASVISGTNLFRAAVATSGFYDLTTYHAWMGPTGATSARWIENEGGRMGIGLHPWNSLQRYVDNSPFFRADRIHTPLLMLQGEIDNSAPYQDAEKMFNALKRLERTVQLAIYKGEGHVIPEWSLTHAVDAATRMIEFLERHLASSTEAGTAQRLDQ